MCSCQVTVIRWTAAVHVRDEMCQLGTVSAAGYIVYIDFRKQQHNPSLYLVRHAHSVQYGLFSTCLWPLIISPGVNTGVSRAVISKERYYKRKNILPFCQKLTIACQL